MDKATEQSLVEELQSLKANKALFANDALGRNAFDKYRSEARFAEESKRIFSQFPSAVAHVSDLPDPGSFLRCQLGSVPILVTRDKSGQARAFINACRHRGTRLVDNERGCQHRFSCPYHAWTYVSSGELLAAPHFEAGFGDLDKSALGLTPLPCHERFGFIWVTPSQDIDFDAHFSGLADDLQALDLEAHSVAHYDSMVCKANWKVIVEGGIEAYHFKVAHRATIAPYFEDNLSTYQAFGPDLRSILPRTSLAKRSANRPLREDAQVLYTLFPSTQLLVQQDHVAWVKEEPLAADRTRITISTLAPKDRAHETEHWQQNHRITMDTLGEDFAIGESIQSTLSSRIVGEMTFGRFEGALTHFNAIVDSYLAG
ncbi:MAG: SRPBCC family protein [Pseudomonadota bacterium]